MAITDKAMHVTPSSRDQWLTEDVGDPMLAQHLQGMRTAEAGQVVIGDDQVPALLGQGCRHLRGADHLAQARLQPSLAQRLPHQSGIVGGILDQQDAQVLRRHGQVQTG